MNVVTPPESGVPLLSDESFFDSLFANEQNLLNLLIAIRSADVDDDQKLELRDLVLEYAQLKDFDKKNQVKNQLEELILKNSSIVDTYINQQKNSLVFATNVANTQKEQPETKVPVKPTIGHQRLNPIFKTIEKNSMAVVDTLPQIDQVVVETPQIPASPGEVNEEKVVLAEISVPEIPMAPHINNPSERISEIKRIINSKVGNPINLIESDNNVGREYMNALLNAMKKTSGSSPAGELDVAMKRLETAYMAVENLIATNPNLLVLKDNASTKPTNHSSPDVETLKEVQKAFPVQFAPEPIETAKVTTPVVPTTQSTTVIPHAVIEPIIPKLEPLTKKLEIKSEVSNEEKEKSAEVDIPAGESFVRPIAKTTSGSLVQEPEEDFRDVVQSEPKPSALSSLASRLFVDRSQAGVAAPAMGKPKVVLAQPKMVSAAPSVTFDVKPKISPVNVMPPIPNPELVIDPPEIVEATIVESPKTTILSPVSTESSVTKKINSFREEMKKRDAEDKLPVTDINATEVTSGLSQLLSEWKLFKTSGFLGTGPSGIDHPLFQKLRSMPMASVIAGRFEGASPEIKQSIADYMNGWRYEQGLVHEMGETFEHYLRRVILHIIGRQSQKPEA